MKSLKQTPNLVIAALMCALTCIATMSIQIPTPGLGYIHPGDGMVLLSGILLGPAVGAIAAGTGSMLADLFTGYVIYAVPTLLIKAATAWIAATVFYGFSHGKHTGQSRQAGPKQTKQLPRLVFAGMLAEIQMAAGYFFYKILLTMAGASSFTAQSFHTGLASALADIPSSIIQGISGIVICIVLFPVLIQIPQLYRVRNEI